MTAPPPLPPGRELDAAVARVLGWRDVRAEPSHFSAGFYYEGWHPNVLGGRRVDLPKFSEDYAAIPELLAWLQQWAGEITLHGEISEEGPDPAKGSFPWAASCVRGDVVETRPLYFDTLPEAICNLVLAVAARRTP